ncbi:lipase [Punctularia strigosozonata HHB-11173 SS5]|uniref:lipase n=1 Tax=Punctularia strigosozonata (strain HHB-11173) TaxID=741275 RepID=UPI00044172DA|nr:lipase [Punctularia strigosozonata HHB-11173 SS5]EIN06272.1 lipase [Punctularia strigosozonata HHB-11173 SS5]
MVSSRLSLSAAAMWVAGALAAPSLHARQSITTLSTSQIEAFKPFTFLASAGYCSPATTLAWDCGTNCDNVPGFEPVASGGDGDSVQFWFVGFLPASKTVVVSHQGTDTSEILPLITDADIAKGTLDSTLFPGISSSVEVHEGFRSAQASAATQVLAAVQTAMSRFGATSVTMVGHSLGGAIALLDAVYLPLHLPSTTTFQTVVYGLPRVGNQAFADYVDAHVTALTHINNEEDIVPILPGMFLGFHHPSGEVHIQDSGAWDACPGQDNSSDLCIVGDVPNIFEGDESDHDGPYDGVEMGC